MMFYNTSARGYPFGIQMGTDHRNICIEIDKDFSRLSYRKIPYRLEAIQVWGCGNNELRYILMDHIIIFNPLVELELMIFGYTEKSSWSTKCGR